MNKNKTIAIALATLFSSSLALADSEMSGKLVVERAGFGLQEDVSGQLKNDTRIRLYADGDITDDATYHVEIQAHNDTAKVGGYSGEFTQNAGLREAYVDLSGGDWEARVGKQQVVWGTADGMKLLDIINPTDYAEMAQDQMEDARIPVWALNIERGNVQAVISQPKENVFAGLNRGTKTGIRSNGMSTWDQTRPGVAGDFGGTDTGNVFKMMGPDSITGEVNGFLNIVPDIGSIAAGFGGQFTNQGLQNYKHFTVGAFNGSTNAALAAMPFPEEAGSLDYMITNGYDGAQIMGGFAAPYNTNLTNATSATDFGAVKDSAFEYMGAATFSTFDAFWNAGSEYTYNMPKDDEADFAIKTSQTTKGGTNYSLNFSNSYDKNPIITTTWRGFDGGLLTQTPQTNYFMFNGTPVTDPADIAAGNYDYPAESLTLADSNGQAYGGVAVTGLDGQMGCTTTTTYYAGTANEYDCTPAQMTDNQWQYAPTLRMEQSVVRTKNIGGSFDTSFNNDALGAVVVRGEALYTRDAKQPVMDKARLAVGDLPGALTMLDADRFKFVLGVDVTVLTNMLISTQYISDRNLDFVDGDQATGKYTADYATMHLSNGFNKGIEDKNFYSVFFSKPFGDSGEHRWNNIYMNEEGDGNWNRFDVSWGLSDDVEGTFELNNYWGNKNTQFGQFKDASNMQTGIKYSF